MLKNRMNTGFKELDDLIDIAQPEIILLTGTDMFINILSGDIANNICLHQEKEVLEIVSHKKEYLIKRLLINNADANYENWTLKTEYTDAELKQIGQSTIDLIETTKRLPTIIEQDINLYNLRKVTKIVSDWANLHADRDKIETLVVLDIYPLNSSYKNKHKKEMNRLLKQMSKISKKLNCPILIVYETNVKDNSETHQPKKLVKKDIELLENIEKYIDKFIIANLDRTKETEDTHLFNLDIYNSNSIIGTCKLNYDYIHRRFIN